jgi:tricorn protease
MKVSPPVGPILCATLGLVASIFSTFASVSAAEPLAIQMLNDMSLSPDGSKLLFRWANEIWVAPTKGGFAQRLTNHPAFDGEPRYSPDGSKIAFISGRTGSNQVYVMPSDGGPAEQKTYHSEGYSLADWFPDGNSLLVTGARDHFWRGANRIMKIDLTQRVADKVLFDDTAANPSLSKDGKKILFVREGERWTRKGYKGERASQIWLLNLEDSTVKEILHEGVETLWPLWMPKSNGFYFTKGSQHGLDLWRYRFANDEQPARQKKLTGFDDDSVVKPTISRDGSTIVFRHLFDCYSYKPGSDEPPQKIEIKIASDTDRPADEIRLNLSRSDDVAFTDDGLEIAFASGGDIW